MNARRRLCKPDDATLTLTLYPECTPGDPWLRWPCFNSEQAQRIDRDSIDVRGERYSKLKA